MKNFQNKNGFSGVDSVLPRFATTHGLEHVFRKHQVLRLWPKAAEAFVRRVGSETQAIDFQNGTLTIACLSSSVAAEVERFRESIVSALNRLLGEDWVRAITIEQ